MSLALLLLAQASAVALDGPDLAEVERAVGKCDTGAMTKVFIAEPQRRRAAFIALFNEQQAIVTARRTLAQRRFDAMSKPAMLAESAPAAPPLAQPDFSLEAQMIADRQQALDDARMLGAMRDNALDMMRQHYLLGCNGSLASTGGSPAATR